MQVSSLFRGTINNFSRAGSAVKEAANSLSGRIKKFAASLFSKIHHSKPTYDEINSKVPPRNPHHRENLCNLRQAYSTLTS